ncbi:putative heptosyltransferase [Melioribacter roseus P3M-2]|uniref:Putative heptosyltransferase n=1 Tax=Melioribacter roseus (strain DSM 23840 / JCM 17771 / VKM B-2668 / P3M-2) TaxID=1191523 RepID=I6YYR1_MELRP|nr:glycosyltransferase family 9 protein [Melioribacter roseus]AFN75722.1 putative heptosyltransferase [Melioribacter roseus P3M-2]
MKKIPDCKNFTGYKPCFPYHNCLEDGCKEERKFGKKILIINLDAMGDVLMTTAQLPAIKRKYPVSTIYWITLKNAFRILDNNPYIDRVFPFDFESILILKEMEFDVIMNVDKSMRSGALAMQLNAKEKLGFGVNKNGQIIPLNKGAEYNYTLGLDDNLKFKINQRTGQEYLAETFDLDYQRDEYVFNFNDEELKFIDNYKKEVGIDPDDEVIGFNTGCSLLFPNKKMTIEQHIVLIEKFLSFNRFKIMLLGGPEDTERNNTIAEYFKGKIINTPTSEGLRRGACYESIPQVIITGDSFGMHLAIALKKYVIAWFGLSCWTEIDLYDRGVKLYPEGLFCAPCWKKECPYNLECIQMIDLERIVKETVAYFDGKK